ncbi:hypothetical protein POF51_08050 [Brevibacillus sp. AG]|uniref:hypothetical protein n=1 Tax=Brevibacillus sp. AG TaxID=3020891 RepID=UPI00232DF625|nr:hypothetical protein [Brevibacillus sp. AG]MDC0760639.1 hypothetical protein [Brevibacillus sp. AG]
MKDWLKNNKKSMLFILTGFLGIIGAAIGLSEDLQLQIVSIFDQLLSSPRP